MYSSSKNNFYNNFDLSCKTYCENTIDLKCVNINSIIIPTATLVDTAFTVSSINNVKASNNTILQFICNINNSEFYGTINFQVFKLHNNQVIPIPVGPVWTFSRKSAEMFYGDTSSNSFSFFVCDCDAYLDGCYTYTVVATVTDGLYGIILTDVATSSTITITHSEGTVVLDSITGTVAILLVDNAVINHVGNTVTITNAGIDGSMEFRSSNGNVSHTFKPNETYTVNITDVNGTANFETVSFGTSLITNATLTALSV